MKKFFILFSLSLFFVFGAWAGDLTAKSVTEAAADFETVEESIDYLENQVTKITNQAEKRSVYIFLASLQELLSDFKGAQLSYAKAAGIAAGTGAGMPVRSNEQIVLDAVRCALSSGDYATAESYLNSSVRNSKNPEIQAYINLYSQWCELCKASNVEDTQEAIVMLQAYLKMKSMESVRPAILLTLWYITGDNKYANEIKSDYPKSVEMAVVKGDVQLLPTPFWFFVPKNNNTDFSSADMEISDVKKSEGKEIKVVSSSTEEITESKDSKWQLGFFKTENNAKLLRDEVKAKGFDAYIATEKRPSGTTYYQVIVKADAKGNVADRLRSAGYDCYLLE